MTASFQCSLADEAATQAFGAKLAALCTAPFVIALEGELGAGKTTLVRGFMRGKGYEDKVKSPSYTLVEEYQLAKEAIFHFDFYRLQDPEELDFIGIQEYLRDDAILLLEWPDKAGGHLPPVDLFLHLSHEGEGRAVLLKALSPRGKKFISQLENLY